MPLWPCIKRRVLLHAGDDILPGGRNSHLRHDLNRLRLENPHAVLQVLLFGVDTEQRVVEPDLKVIVGIAVVGRKAGYQQFYLRTA